MSYWPGKKKPAHPGASSSSFFFFKSFLMVEERRGYSMENKEQNFSAFTNYELERHRSYHVQPREILDFSLLYCHRLKNHHQQKHLLHPFG